MKTGRLRQRFADDVRDEMLQLRCAKLILFLVRVAVTWPPLNDSLFAEELVVYCKRSRNIPIVGHGETLSGWFQNFAHICGDPPTSKAYVRQKRMYANDVRSSPHLDMRDHLQRTTYSAVQAKYRRRARAPTAQAFQRRASWCRRGFPPASNDSCRWRMQPLEACVCRWRHEDESRSGVRLRRWGQARGFQATGRGRVRPESSCSSAP